jgi:hypothetical protein
VVDQGERWRGGPWAWRCGIHWDLGRNLVVLDGGGVVYLGGDRVMVVVGGGGRVLELGDNGCFLVVWCSASWCGGWGSISMWAKGTGKQRQWRAPISVTAARCVRPYIMQKGSAVYYLGPLAC